MGIFSSKEQINVGTAAMHLIDATEAPVNNAVVSAILDSGVPYASRKDISGRILHSHLNSLASKVGPAQDYARASYKLGLPEGAAQSYNPLTSTELSPYILGETGYSYALSVEESHFDDYTPGLAIYEFLLNTRGYDPETNQISNRPAGIAFVSYFGENPGQYPQKVEVRDVTLAADRISADIAYTLWTYRPVVKEGASRYESSVVTEWVMEVNPFIENVAIAGATVNDVWDYPCLFAVYKQFDSGGTLLPTRHVWVYRISDGTYPALDPAVVNQPDEFMPVIPIRYNNVDLTDPTTQNTPEDTTNLWSTSKKLLRKYGMDLESLGTAINSNPDIAEIDHAYVMWAVDLQSNNAASLFYLTEFFLNQSLIQNSDETAFQAALSDPAVLDEPISRYRTNRNNVTSFTEHGLDLEIRYDYITTDLTINTIGTGKIGYAEKTVQSYTAAIYEEYTNDNGDPWYITKYQTRYKLILKAQVSATQVRTVTVHNLKVVNNVYGAYAVITDMGNVINDPDEHNMLIPLEYNLSTTYSLQNRNSLYSDCAMMVINTVQKTKLKWYQSSWFKIVLTVIAVVITVWTGQAWVKGLADAMAADTAMVYVAASMGITALASLAVSWVIENYGDKLGILGSIVLAVVASVVTRGVGTAAGFTMTTSQAVIQTASAIVSSANEFLVQEGVAIKEEYDAFRNKLSGLWDELEDVQDLLKNKADVDPLLFTNPDRLLIVPNESPSTFYARSLGLPNNTMSTIHDQIYNFMDNRLKLDKSPDLGAYS